MLKSFFAAKWQHKKNDIRQQALNDFDSVKDANIIVKMVMDDPSEDIRNQALAKLTEPKHLQELLDKAATPTDWLIYALKFNELSPQTQSLVDRFNEVKNQWNNEEIIKAIATCKDTEMANALLMTNNEPEALFEMAKNAKSIDIRLEAVAKINDLEELHRLVKESTNKKVLKAVKLKLSDARQALKQCETLQENAENFLASMEKLSQQSWLDHQFEVKVKSLLNKWQQNEKESSLIPSPQLQQVILELKVRFLTALDTCYDRILKNQNEIQRATLEHDAINKQKALCSQLTKLVSEVNEEPEKLKITERDEICKSSVDKFNAIKTAADFLIKSWKETTVIIKAEPQDNENYISLTNKLTNYFKAWENLFELEVIINEHIESKPEDSLEALDSWLNDWQSLKNKLAWPKQINSPDVLINWTKTVDEISSKKNKLIVSQKKKAAYINQKLKLLEKECQRKNLLAANKLSNYINLQLDYLSSDFRATIESKIEKIQPQLDELRDWHSFATTPKKQELCEAMESLQVEVLEPLEKATKVRKLQQQWRELKASNAVADEALWDRFKQASDVAYLPCLAFYEQQDKIKADNLHKKIEICDRLEKIIKDNKWGIVESALPDSDAENKSDIDSGLELQLGKSEDVVSSNSIDWKSLDQLISKTDQEWKKLQPVPENEKLSIQHHFNTTSRIIRDKIRQEKQSNLDMRCALVEKANQLLNLDEFNLETIEKSVKAAILLQKQWKQLGLTFFKADREQWQLFRQAIDRVFAKREELNQSQKEELKIGQQKITEITQKINALINVGDLELRSSYENFEALKSDVPDKADLPKNNASRLLLQLDKACGAYQNHLDGLDNRLQKLKFDSLINAGLLLQQAEEQLLNNMNPLSSDEKEKLQQKFDELYLDNNDKDFLSLRLQEILNVNNIKENTKGTSQLLELALELEILLSLESPEQYSEQRMVIQLERLKEGMGSSLSDSDKNTLILNALKTWLSIGFINPDKIAELESRRVKIIQQLSV